MVWTIRATRIMSLVFLTSCTPAWATTLPFVEDFAVDSSNWFDGAGNDPLFWSGDGGPDGSSFAFGTLNFAAFAAEDTPLTFRAQDDYGSSGGAFEGDWIGEGVEQFRAFVRHDAPVPLNFFVRFSSPANFPGAVALIFVPTPGNTWTEISVPLDGNNPQFITFEGSDFETVFGSIGHIQIGISVPESLAGVDQTFTFEIDKPTILPTGVFATPSDDRWNYPFNFSPGTRETASTFGAVGLPDFNNRDGEIAVAWDTAAQITPGQGTEAYNIHSISITMTHIDVAEWLVDLTPDEWFTFDLNGDGELNGDGIERGEPGDVDGESTDRDPGRPVELFGAGFGPVYDLFSWNETSPYIGSTFGSPNSARDPFPFVFQDQTLDLLHVEDNVSGLWNEDLDQPVFEFTPQPWAIGVPMDYTPGEQETPFDVAFEIDLCLSNGAVRNYFQQQLDAGRVAVIVTALTEAAEMAPPGGFPSFFMKEAVGEILDAKAPHLEIELGAPLEDCNANGIPDVCETLSDINNNGVVDIVDLLEVLAQWGSCPDPPEGCPADTDCNGAVDIIDLLNVIANWS